MDTVIYSASPLKAYAGGIFMIALFFVLGVFGLLSAVLPGRGRKKAKPARRILMGMLGALMCACGVILILVMVREYQGGVKTVLVRITEKRIVEKNCPDGGVCKDYVIDSNDGEKNYVFGPAKTAWDKIEENACYRFTYFPAQSLLGDSLSEEDAPPSFYETTGAITRIELANCP